MSPRARETTMFQGEVALPLPVAEEGSESARQAPVFYEDDSPDGKYVGANEKCRPFRAPQESIRETIGFIRMSAVLQPQRRWGQCYLR